MQDLDQIGSSNPRNLSLGFGSGANGLSPRSPHKEGGAIPPNAVSGRCYLVFDTYHAISRPVRLDRSSACSISVIGALPIAMMSRAPRRELRKFHAQFSITKRRFLNPM